jgi:hypothetical protein
MTTTKAKFGLSEQLEICKAALESIRFYEQSYVDTSPAIDTLYLQIIRDALEKIKD